MAETIVTDQTFTTNGTEIPAGKVSTDDLRSAFRDAKGQPISEDIAKAMQDDLMRRQIERNAYMGGIHEKRSYTKDSGSFAVGNGAE